MSAEEQKNPKASVTELYSSIFSRKSCRKYIMTPLNTDELTAIRGIISSFPLLFPDAPLDFRIFEPSEVKAFGKINAPHYMMVFGQGRPGEAENAGFLFQQWVLWMSAHGYGTVWLGFSKPVSVDKGSRHLITIAFGRAAGSLTRITDEFNRKALNEIVEGYDSRLEAARFAPSGNNIQPWHFIVFGNQASGQKIYIYKKRAGMNKLFYDYPALDMGIVMSHLYLASESAGLPFSFSTDTAGAPEPPKGYSYFGMLQ